MTKSSASHSRTKSSSTAKHSRQAAAKHAAGKRAKTRGRVHKSRLAEVTAELDGQVTQVHDLYTDIQVKPSGLPSPLPDDSVQVLAEVMRGL